MSLSRRECVTAAALLLAGCGTPRPRELSAQEMPREGAQVLVSAAPGEPALWFAVWQRRRGAWQLSLRPALEPLRIAVGDGPLSAVVASSLSRTGVESERASLRLIEDD